MDGPGVIIQRAQRETSARFSLNSLEALNGDRSLDTLLSLSKG